MFCRKCGNEIPDDSEFCPKCGIKVEIIDDGEETRQEANTVSEPVPARSQNPASTVTLEKAQMLKNNDLLICKTCGKPVPKGNAFCPACGTDMPKDEIPRTEKTADKQSKKKSNKKIIISLGAVIAAVAAVMLIVFYPVYSTLHKEFSYIIDSDKFVVITGYLGEDTNIVIPDIIKGKPVKAIAENAFKDSDITSIQLNNELEIIGPNAFENCSRLEEVTMQDKSIISSIGDEAFYNCTSLQGIYIETLDNTIEVGKNTFYNCRSLTSIPFFGDLCPLGVGAFEKCTSLKEAHLYKAAISPRCFAGCTLLESVECEIGGGIGYEAFSGCENLSEITVRGSKYTNPFDLSKNGRIVYGKDAFLDCDMFMKQHHDVAGTNYVGKTIKELVEKYDFIGSVEYILGFPVYEYNNGNCRIQFRYSDYLQTNNSTIVNDVYLKMVIF